MFRRLVVLTGLVVGVAGSAVPVRVGAQNGPSAATFNRDVLPILQKNCQSCHRPGEIGPMSFMTYKDTRPWARATHGVSSTVALLTPRPSRPMCGPVLGPNSAISGSSGASAS